MGPRTNPRRTAPRIFPPLANTGPDYFSNFSVNLLRARLDKCDAGDDAGNNESKSHLRSQSSEVQGDYLCPGASLLLLSQRLSSFLQQTFRQPPLSVMAVARFLAEHNQQPKPFVWTKDPDEIIAAVKRGHPALDSIH